MATRKAGSTAKKKTTTKVKSTTTAKPTTTTKVTTVKAVAADSAAARADSPRTAGRFNNKTIIASALIGEFIGAFLITIAFMGTKGEPQYMGFAFAGVVFLVGAISGAHINPAVTVGAWVTRKVTSLRAVGYIVAQILGATLAFVALNTFVSSAPQIDAQSAAMTGQQTPQLFSITKEITTQNQWYLFFIELIAATIFTFGIAGARRIVGNRTAVAFTAGFSLLLASIFGTIAAGYLSAHAVFNPAVALAVQAVNWSQFNIVAFAAFIIAPLLGGVIGFGLRDVLSVAEKKA